MILAEASYKVVDMGRKGASRMGQRMKRSFPTGAVTVEKLQWSLPSVFHRYCHQRVFLGVGIMEWGGGASCYGFAFSRLSWVEGLKQWLRFSPLPPPPFLLPRAPSYHSFFLFLDCQCQAVCSSAVQPGESGPAKLGMKALRFPPIGAEVSALMPGT